MLRCLQRHVEMRIYFADVEYFWAKKERPQVQPTSYSFTQDKLEREKTAEAIVRSADFEI